MTNVAIHVDRDQECADWAGQPVMYGSIEKDRAKVLGPSYVLLDIVIDTRDPELGRDSSAFVKRSRSSP